jgi:hypothetical protein
MNPAAIVDPSERLPFVGAAGSLRFELELASGDGLEGREDPFVPLSDSGRYSRVLLGRIASTAGSVLLPLAVKVQRSSYRSGKEPLTNPQIEELWTREREILSRSAADGVVAAVDVGDRGVESPPVTFCKKIRRYFHPPCPRCGSALSDCRDDALLREQGLPEYSASGARFLHCAECAGRAGKKIVYTASPPGDGTARGGVEIRRRGELYRDFTALVRGGGDAETKRRLVAFPCASCEHRASCYPAAGAPSAPIPAESLLVPLSYHEFRLIALEAWELHYDEFADLLGGAAWEAIRQRALQGGGEGRGRLLQAMDRTFSSPHQWLWRGDPGGRWPLEVLRLKLRLFSGACRGLRTLHASSRAPHLNVSPSKVMVRLAPPLGGVPARWAFHVALAGLASATRLPPEARRAPAAAALLFPAPDADPAFLSPLARGAAAGHEEPMRVTLRAAKEEGSSVQIQGTASSDRIRLDDILPGDALRIIPSTSAGALENAVLWVTVEGREDRALTFSGVVPRGPAPVKPSGFDAAVTHYRALRAPCDLYGAGMLLFRALLVNDERDFFAVDASVQRVLKQMALKYDGREAPSPERAAEEIQELVEADSETFLPSALLYLREDRSPGPSPIPARLWSDLLLLGFRLVSSIPGFGYASDHADVDPDRPEELMDRVLRDVAELETRVDVELFSRAERDQEISEVCSAMMDEATGLGPTGTSGA